MTKTLIIRFLPLLALLAALLPSQMAHANADADHNAALRYWRGMAMMTPELEETINAVEFDLLVAPDWTPDDELREALESQGAQSAIHEFIKGGRLQECDFGKDLEDGIGFLLPHLGGLRVTAKLLLMDGRMKLADGDPEAAAQRFAAAYALAANSAGDEFIVSSLVSVSILTLCNEVVLHEPVLHQLGEEGRKTVGLATWRFEDNDPFHLSRAIEYENLMMTTWLRSTFSEPVSEVQVRAFFEDWFGESESDASVKNFLTIVNDPDRFEAELARLRLWYVESASALNQPDAVAALEAMNKSIGVSGADHPYGIFTEMLAPSVSRAKKSELNAIAELEKARSMLAN